MRIKHLTVLLVFPLAYLALCAFAAGILAYPLHFLLPEDSKFHGLVFTSGQILMFIGLIPLGRYLGIGKAEMGVACTATQILGQVLRGFGYGALMLGIHVLLLVLFDVRRFDPQKLQLGLIAGFAGKSILVGLGVALTEEPVFRGFLLGALHRNAGRVTAVLIASAYFAALHFLRTDMRPQYADVHWDTGILIVADAFSHLLNIQPDAFLALFAAGAFLCCVRLLAPAINFGYCFGIHAGWVFIIKTTNPLSLNNEAAPWGHWVSQFDGTIGYLSATWTTVLIVLLAMKMAKNSNNISAKGYT